MALNFKDHEAERLVRALAEATGESLTEAMKIAVRERLVRVTGRRNGSTLADVIAIISVRCAALPVLDDRSPDEILGYDEHGLPA